jgi:hypothetical protein
VRLWRFLEFQAHPLDERVEPQLVDKFGQDPLLDADWPRPGKWTRTSGKGPFRALPPLVQALSKRLSTLRLAFFWTSERLSTPCPGLVHATFLGAFLIGANLTIQVLSDLCCLVSSF